MEEVYRTTNRDNRHNAKGEEILNDTPMQPPVGYKPQPSLIETIREQVRAHYLLLADEEIDTEEEADDFDIPDDPIDPHSPWENDNIPSLKEARQRLSELEEEEKTYVTQATAKKAQTVITPADDPLPNGGSSRTS